MQQVVQVIGGAGTGKTHYLLGVMEKIIETGISPMQIGFVTFTKAARREAAERAGAKFGYSAEDLEQGGYFKTLHAACYMLLQTRAAAMITDNKESREWIAQAIGEKIDSAESLGGAEPFAGRSDSELALGLWHCSRNRMEPFTATWERAEYTDERTPGLPYCKKIIEQYEHYKRLDGRLDFTDLLGQFAGFKFRFEGPEPTEPMGEPPSVPVWFLDECQDNSALTDAVARRLTSKAKWVYLVADPFQAIYGWAGADARHFQSWPISDGKRKLLQQTHRCPAPIIKLGENILRECSDYWDRGILPAPHAGKIERLNYGERWIDAVKPTESWLLIARTNFQAAGIAKRLDADGIPWQNSGKGNNKWNAPVKHKTILAMRALHAGHAITETEWKLILKGIKNTNGKEYFKRGTKKEWENRSKSDPEQFTNLEHCQDWGATPDFVAMIKLNYWTKFINGSEDYLRAAKKWGHDVVENSGIRVGTIHSVKGSEADNVLLLTTTSHQIHKGQEDREGANEERRVEYVAVTRTRKNLFICSEKKAKFSMLRDH
jgi:DNA helicase II / ATP-dependent DNA helicase PcrA